MKKRKEVLREECEKRYLGKSGNKSDLVERLMAYQAVCVAHFWFSVELGVVVLE